MRKNKWRLADFILISGYYLNKRMGRISMEQKKIGKAIAYLRKQKGLTQTELAKQLHITDKAVSKWERGLATPDVMLLPKLSIILETDIESILAGNIAHYNYNWEGILIFSENENEDIYVGTYLYNKPLVYIMLSYFLLVGIKKITIVCGEKNQKFIKEKIQCWNINIEICFLKEISDFRVNQSNIMLVYENVFLYGLDLTKYFQRAMALINNENQEAALLLVQSANNKGKLILDNQRKVYNRGEDYRYDPIITYDECPIVFLSEQQAKQLIRKKNCQFKNEIDIMKKKQSLYGVGIGRGMLYCIIQTRKDVMLVSNLIQIIEETVQSKIYDVKDIAIGRGLVL